MCVKLLALLILARAISEISSFELTIIHMNDFHSRYDQVNPDGDNCGPNITTCIGGFSRLYTATKQLMSKRPNPIVLNAGDNFQGTLWYSIFKWNVTQRFFNLLPLDAMTLGNHEFDDGIDGLVPFLKATKTPVVVANLNDTLEPKLQGLYSKSIVINKAGKKIGIVGVLTSNTKAISRTGKLLFRDEQKSINAEAKRLLKKEGVFTVIVLSHCGYSFELDLAKKSVPGISVIVGGHSNTLLYNGSPPVGTPSGPYPTSVTSIHNKTVLVVQADGYGRYLGNLTVKFDKSGQPVSWTGKPVYLDVNIRRNKTIDAILDWYRDEVENIGRRVVGSTDVLLDYESCPYSECIFGDLITDCMRDYYLDKGINVGIAMINSGSIRTRLNIGNIIVKDLKTAIPFEDTINLGYLKGRYLKSIMEKAAAPSHFRKTDFRINLIQISGAKIIVDMNQPVSSRVISFKIQTRRGRKKIYEDVKPDKYYPVVLTTYLAQGGDGYKEIKENLTNFTVGRDLVDVLGEYIGQKTPLNLQTDGRIVVRDQQKSE